MVTREEQGLEMRSCRPTAESTARLLSDDSSPEGKKELYFQAIINHITSFGGVSEDLVNSYTKLEFESFEHFTSQFSSYILKGRKLEACQSLLTRDDKWKAKYPEFGYREATQLELKQTITEKLLDVCKKRIDPEMQIRKLSTSAR